MSRGFLLSLIPLGLLGLAVFLFGWFVQNHQPWPIDVRTPPHPDVLRNPYLAAQRVLERMGVQVEVIESFRRHSLPELPATLVILPSRHVLSERQNDELMAWVRRGGHLVVGAHPSADAERLDLEGEPYFDPILTELGIWAVETGSSDPITVFAHGGRVVDESTPLRIDLPTVRHLGREEDSEGARVFWLGTETVDLCLRIALDAGAITVLGEPLLLQNAWLDRGDNGVAMWEALNWYPQPAPVWLVPQLTPPRLAELIWTHASHLVVSVLVLAAAWVFARARRFGPVRPDPEPIRRGLEEHLRATGRLLWNRGGAAFLLRETLLRLEARARRRNPGWARLATTERHARLAAASGLSAEAVAAAVQEGGRERFDDRVRQLEGIRRSL